MRATKSGKDRLAEGWRADWGAAQLKYGAKQGGVVEKIPSKLLE